MRKGPFLGLLIGLLLTATTAGATGSGIPVYLDMSPLPLSVPAKLENSTTMVPLRSVAEALGAQVDWVDEGNGKGSVHLWSYPRHFSPPVGQGTARSMRSSPADPQALGASATLIQHLSAEQAASLTSGGPALVRFDLLDLQSSCYVPPPEDLADFCDDGFQFAIRLYYSQYDSPSFPLGVAAYQRVTEADGTSVGGVPRLSARNWYEDYTLWVRPVGEPVITEQGERTIVQHGTQGWTVDQASRTLLRTVELEQNPFLIHGSYGR